MAQQPTFYNDGQWSVGFQVGANPVKYPFENYSAPDVYARLTYLSLRILPANYSPLMAMRTSYTNLILQSEALTTTWAATNLTVTAAGRANPGDGQVTMFKCLETVANAAHYNAQTYASFTAAYTFSIFVAGGLGRDYQYIRINDGTADRACFFNTTTGVVGTASGGAVGSIQAQTDGSYRLSITATCAAGSGSVFFQSAQDGSTVSYAGDITKGFYAWGAQLQLAAAVGPYIPTTTPARTISSPDWQPTVDPFAYLIWESDFTLDQIQRASFQRMYGRIPKQQISYPGSRYIPLPSVTNTYGTADSITVYNFTPYLPAGVGYYNTEAGAIFTADINALYGTVKVPTASSPGYATGGTFTLTFGASTTGALNYNDSGATITTALNGLASIISAGLVASVTTFLTSANGGSLLITWTSGGTIAQVTMNAGSLGVTTSQNPTTQVFSLTVQQIYLPDHITITSHGFNTGVALAAGVGNISTGDLTIIIQPVGTWGSFSSNVLWVPTTGGLSSYLFAGPFSQTLAVGQSFLLRTQVLEQYFLPGVSVGINTPADIPIPSDIQSNTAFVTALLGAPGYYTYQSEGPAPWMDSLIYVLKLVQINTADIG